MMMMVHLDLLITRIIQGCVRLFVIRSDRHITRAQGCARSKKRVRRILQDGQQLMTKQVRKRHRFSAYQIFQDSGRTSLTEDFVRIAQLITETIQIFLRIFSNDVLILKMTFDFGVNRFIASEATRIAPCTRPKIDDLRNNDVLRLWVIFACLLYTFDNHFSLLIHYFIG